MSSPTKPTVYVVVEVGWSSGDVYGCLLLPTGEAPFSHMSSSEDWLVRDLTVSFADRREALARRYPDGYDVVVVRSDADVPDDVKAANRAWAASLPDGDDASEDVVSS